MNHQLYSRALVNSTALDRRGQHAGRIQHGYHGTALVSINAEKDKTLTVEGSGDFQRKFVVSGNLVSRARSGTVTGYLPPSTT